MLSPGLRLGGPLISAALALAVFVGGIALLMPATIGALIAVWVAISVPIGIAVGHCTLNRED